VKYLVLWILHNEEVARKMIKADKKRHKEIQEWLDSDSNTTWDEWQNLKNGNNNEGG
jgi:Ni/Co efflux regulator RcnB